MAFICKVQPPVLRSGGFPSLRRRLHESGRSIPVLEAGLTARLSRGDGWVRRGRGLGQPALQRGGARSPGPGRHSRVALALRAPGSEAVRRKGYEACKSINNCMYGGAEGILNELREKVGHPFTLIPSDMFRYGAGGIVGWGTVCGALN